MAAALTFAITYQVASPSNFFDTDKSGSKEYIEYEIVSFWS